jgi:hypothetical protein
MHLTSDSIKVRIVGGLGNQLFGVVFGLAVSEKINAKLILDGSFVSLGSNSTRKIAVRDFDIEPFSISYTGEIVQNIPFLNRNKLIRKIVGKILRYLKSSISEEELTDSFKFKAGQAFTGYFHKWSYADCLFDKYPNFKLNLKSKSHTLLNIEKSFKSKNPICVHVRLGDFLVHSNLYSVLPEKYYLEAITQIQNKFSDREVWVFTENEKELINYYPKLANISNLIIDQETSISDSESFYLLSTSKFLVTSNSTFSLWAAWFVDKSGNYVIVPCFRTNKDLNGGLLDKRWNSINTESFEFIQAKK